VTGASADKASGDNDSPLATFEPTMCCFATRHAVGRREAHAWQFLMCPSNYSKIGE